MRKLRTPQPAPIVDQLREFYRANRDEWLTAQDIATKFDVAVTTAQAATRALEQEGAIKQAYVFYVPRDTTL